MILAFTGYSLTNIPPETSIKMEEKIRILHLEDMPLDAELVARELKRGKMNSEILVVDNKLKFEKALIDFLPDIIFSDHSLVSLDSHEALRIVKKMGVTVPFILITATMTDEFAVQVMKEGADDYIIKDRLHRLPSAVINSIKKYRLEQQQLAYQANIIRSEAKLKESQAIAHIGNWEYDFSTGKVLWSEEHCRIYGTSITENVQSYHSWMSFIHPDDIESVVENIKNKDSSSTDNTLNYRIVLNDGTVKHIHVISKFEFDEDGNQVGLYGTAHDVTEIRQTERQLRKSETFNLSVLNSLSSHIAVINNLGNIVARNASWKRFALENGPTTLKGTEEGSNYFKVCETAANNGDETAAEVLQGIKNVMEGKQDVFYFEYPCHSPTESRWFSMRVIKFNSEEPMVVLSHQNISERKFAELERIKITGDLIQRNHDLVQFAYIVSHNLRAPVANIIGASSALNSFSLDVEEKELLSQGIYDSVTRLDEVIKDLSNVLQIKSKLRETEEKVRFSELVEDITISIKNLIEKENIQILCDFSEIDEFVTIKSYLYSIFYNLITNSIKYRQQQIAGIIIIKSYLTNNKIVLTFLDNGMGIDLSKRKDQIFGLYKRFHHHIEGKGTGLFMVKTQVETLGGSIDIESTVNKGTEFKIEFNK